MEALLCFLSPVDQVLYDSSLLLHNLVFGPNPQCSKHCVSVCFLHIANLSHQEWILCCRLFGVRDDLTERVAHLKHLVHFGGFNPCVLHCVIILAIREVSKASHIDLNRGIYKPVPLCTLTA